MKIKLMVAVVLTFIFFLISLCYVEIISCFAKEDPDVAALLIQQMRWTKSSFKKAEKRLDKVYIGMTKNDFWNTMEMETFQDNDGNIITVAMDGFILNCNEFFESPKVGKIKTYIFGYVDTQNLLHEKICVVVKDDKVIEKIRLDDYENKVEKNSRIEIIPQFSKEAYSRALESAKKIKVGMWSAEVRLVMNMIAIWSGQNINRMESLRSAEGQFFIFAPAFLREKSSEERTDDGLIQHFVFGYKENDKMVPGFIIHLKNFQVIDVEYLLAE